MASAKEKKIDKIILRIAFPVAIIGIILSLTGIFPLPRSMTMFGIVVLLFALIVSFDSSKKQKRNK